MLCCMLSVTLRASGPKLGHVNLAKMCYEALRWGILLILALAVIVIQINDSGTFLWCFPLLGIIDHVLMEIWFTCAQYVR